MKRRYFIFILGLALISLLGKHAHAQNIRGDTIYLSEKGTKEIVFSGKIDSSKIDDPNPLYSIKFSRKNTAIRLDAKPGAKDQLLYITEGKRKHLFILSYKEGVLADITYWNNLKKLRDHVRKNRDKTARSISDVYGLLNKSSWTEAEARFKPLLYVIDSSSTNADDQKHYHSFREIRKQIRDYKWRMYTSVRETAIRYYKDSDYINGKKNLLEALIYMPGDTQTIKDIHFFDSRWFTGLVKRGEEAKKNENYIEAKSNYETALDIYRDDSLFMIQNHLPSMKMPNLNVSNKLEEVRPKANSQIYTLEKTIGDRAYDAQDYEVAQKAYDSALAVRRNRTETKEIKQIRDRIKESKEKLAQRIEEEAKYSRLLDSAARLAEKASSIADYDRAIAAYQKAKKLNGTRDFPPKKINELTGRRKALLGKQTTGKSKSR